MKGLSVYLNSTYDDGSRTEQVARAAATGAEAIEYRPWHDEQLDDIVAACDDHELNLAYLSGSRVPLTDPDHTDDAIEEGIQSVERAKAIGCPTINLSPGPAQNHIPRETQLENTINVLEEVAPVAEDVGVTLVMEPLNNAVDHPEAFLSSSYEGYEIADAVDSPNVKILFDIYHQQITEGNIIQNITEHIDCIGHFHIADVPGRHEPGTGELNYENIIMAIKKTDYSGYIGCEFFPSRDPNDCVRHVKSLL